MNRMTARCTAIVHKALAIVAPLFRLDLRGGIHGVPHWSRVWLHGRRLARALDVDPAVLAWFAFLHDSQRQDDGYDPGHGVRAADFAVRLRKDGLVRELDASHFEYLCEAMRQHSDGHIAGAPVMLACWDADRLDLQRAGITPQAERLCSTYARHPAVIRNAVRLSMRRPPKARRHA